VKIANGGGGVEEISIVLVALTVLIKAIKI
jgi:hypothetical protein